MIFLLAALADCGGTARAPGCHVAASATLPAGALADLGNARLDRAGDGFTLVARSDDGARLRFARLGFDGALGPETAVDVPVHVSGPFYAVTSQSAPGDQLLVVYGLPTPTTGAVSLQIIAATSGAAAAPSRPLLGADGKPVILPPPAAGAKPWVVAMGSSASGKRAVLTWGSPDAKTAPGLLLLDGGGTPRAPAAALADSTGPWSCLAVTQSRAQFGISRMVLPVPPADRQVWSFSEFDDDGTSPANFNLALTTSDGSCPTVGPTPRGYTFTWQTRRGTYFADIDTTRPGGDFYTSSFIKGAVRFGGPDDQPPVSAVVSSGQDFSLVFDGPNPTIDRFSLFGVPQGGTLTLPAHNRQGPLSAWSGTATVYMTYLDQGGGQPGRRFTKVECPASTTE